MNKIILSSCSELLVDTRIYDPEIAYERLTRFMEKNEMESSPPLSGDLLKRMKSENEHYEREDDESYEREEIVIYDKSGNRAWLEYGGNGYITTGFRFDSQCNDWDGKCYPIFKCAIDELDGELIACDGGTTRGFESFSDIVEIVMNSKLEEYLIDLDDEEFDEFRFSTLPRLGIELQFKIKNDEVYKRESMIRKLRE